MSGLRSFTAFNATCNLPQGVRLGDLAVVLVQLDADAAAAEPLGGQQRGAAAGERVQDHAAVGRREERQQILHQLQGLDRGMVVALARASFLVALPTVEEAAGPAAVAVGHLNVARPCPCRRGSRRRAFVRTLLLPLVSVPVCSSNGRRPLRPRAGSPASGPWSIR